MNVRGKQTQPLKSADQTEFNDRTKNSKVTHLNHECEGGKIQPLKSAYQMVLDERTKRNLTLHN